MNSLTTRMLAAALLIAALVPISLAQGEASTPASLFAQAQQSEEQERDFDKAKELYTQAMRLAQATKDAALVEQVRGALTRLDKRAKGEASEPTQEIVCRVAELVSELPGWGEHDLLERCYGDIALFGAVAVPLLENAASGGGATVCNRNIPSSPVRATEALARMSVPEADAALDRLGSSPDPLTRRAVADALRFDRHRALLDRLVKDPVAAVSDVAGEGLSRTNDPKLLELMSKKARDGREYAIDWMCRQQPIALVGLVADTTVDEELRAQMAYRLKSRSALPADARAVTQLLEVARRSSSSQLGRNAMACVHEAVTQRWKPVPEDVLRELETTLAKQTRSFPQPEATLTLLAVGGGEAIEAIAGELPILLQSMDQNAWREFRSGLKRQLALLEAADFPKLALAFVKIPYLDVQDGSSSTYRELYAVFDEALRRLIVLKHPAPTQIVAAFEVLPAPHRGSLQEGLVDWLGSESPHVLDPYVQRDPKSWMQVARHMASASDRNSPAGAALLMGKLGAVELVPDLLVLWQSLQDRSRPHEALQRLSAEKPSEFRAALERGLSEALARRDGALARGYVRMLRFVPGDAALAIAQRVWPQSFASGEHVTLLDTLVEYSVGAGATAFIAEKYASLPASASDVRQSAMQRFGRELYEPSIPLLGEALKDPDSHVRETARTAFGLFKQQREALEEFDAWMAADKESRAAVDELVKLLESPNGEVVIGAVKALAALKARGAYPRLVKLLERNDPALKQAVKEAIDKLAQ